MTTSAADVDSILPASRAAVSAFLERARAIPPDRWRTPRAPGKWSPAQVTEHVTLSYEQNRKILLGEVTAPAMAGIKQWLARTFFLPKLFKRGDFTQQGLQSPAFILPSANPAPAAELLPRLEGAAQSFERDIVAAASTGRKAAHPFFGSMAPAALLNFVLIHTNHHRPQLTAASG